MSDPRKAGVLILSNLEMFNEAARLLSEHIEPEIFGAINDEFAEWLKKNGWDGDGDWLNSDETWVGPPEWKLDDDDNGGKGKDWKWKAYFSFDYKSEKTNSYSLADLCGCGQTPIGFRFQLVFETFSRKQWTNFCKTLPDAALQLLEHGFGYDKASWFLPVTLTSAGLAAAYESGDFTEALQPLRTALDQLKKAQSIFDEIIKAAELAINGTVVDATVG